MTTDKNQIDMNSQMLVMAMAIAIIFISLLCLIGTLLDFHLMASLSENWINIKPNTILCFLFTGAGILLASYKFRYSLFSVAVIILLTSGATLFEYLAGVDLGIDELIMEDIAPNSPNTVSAGRMSLITSINFMLVAFVFFMQIRQVRPTRVIQFLAWLIALIAVLSLFNYLYGAEPSYNYAKYSTMSIITVALFILTSVGILFITPDVGIVGIMLRKNNTGYILRRVILIPIVVPIFFFQLGLYFQKQGLINTFGGIVIAQMGILIIIGVMIVLVSNILERREKEVHESELKLLYNQAIFAKFSDNVDIVFYTTTPHLDKIMYVSRAYEKIWGKKIESLYKNPMDLYDSIISEDRERIKDLFLAGLKEGCEYISAEYRIKRPDGIIRNIFSRIYHVRDVSAEPFPVIGIAVDVTQTITQKIKDESKYELSLLIENEKKLDHFLHRALAIIGRALNMDYCSIWMINQTEDVLRCVDAWYNDKDENLKDFDLLGRKLSYHKGECFLGKVWETRGSTWVPDYASCSRCVRSGFSKNIGLNSAFGLPITYQGEIFGIMEFLSYGLTKPNENLLNRPTFENELNDLIRSSGSKYIAVLVIDIDRFKLINEGFGHDAGDKLLALVAMRLASYGLQMSTILARLGGDKYIMAIQEADRKTTLYYAEGIMQMLHQPFELDSTTVIISISIGIAVSPQDGQDAKLLVGNADLALHKAKNQGGGKISFFTKDMLTLASKNIIMLNELREGIASEQFILEYQPQIDLKTNTLCGAEALVRWQHPTRGLIYPNEFISYAEYSGLIVSLNELIIRKVFEQISLVKVEIPISVNISSQQFEGGFHFVEFLESLMIEFGVSVTQIELEITENMLVKDIDHNIALLTALSELGFQISIDDFGTGFSSFSYLNNLPAHKVKIDRSFITGLPGNATNYRIVKAIISLMHSLDKVVVAEGAETEAEVEFLKQEKCDIVQGFYYYKPMPFDKLTSILRGNTKAIDH